MGLVTFSYAPLEMISYLAAGVVFLTGVAIAIYTVLYFLFPGAPHGFQTLLVSVLFLGAVQLLCLSIIGAYLGKIFEEIKARPTYLVQDVRNDHRAETAAVTFGRKAAAQATDRQATDRQATDRQANDRQEHDHEDHSQALMN
jgi:hypothetical protein